MRSGIAAAVVTVALIVVGLAARRGVERRTGDGPTTMVLPSLPTLFNYLMVVAVVLGIAIAVFLLTQRNRMGRRRKNPRERIPLWAQALALVVIVGVAALLSEALGGLIDLEALVDFRDSVEQVIADGVRYESSQLMGGVLTAFLTVALTASIVWWYLMVRAEVAGPEGPPPTEAFVAAAVRDLDEIDDPRAAILACYAHLQQMVAISGVVTRRSDTPLELLERVLASRNVDPDSITTLTRLFERARFSSHDVDESMRARARAALEDIRGGLESP